MSVMSGKPLTSGAQGLAASESTSVGRRGLPGAGLGQPAAWTAASLCPPLGPDGGDLALEEAPSPG